MTAELIVRKYVTFYEEVFRDGGYGRGGPLVRIAAAAVFRNPWADAGFVEDLWPGIYAVAPTLARELTRRILKAAGGPDRIQGFGKAVVVGEGGEIEHGAALLHGPHFAPYFRKAVNGTSPVSFTEVRGGPGTPAVIPTVHKTATATRDYYQSFQVYVPDAPHRDEIVLVLGAVLGPRLNARSGDKTTDPVVNLDVEDWRS